MPPLLNPRPPLTSITRHEFLALVRHGNLSALRELLATADPRTRRHLLTAQDETGNTALLIAVRYEYPNVTSLLLQLRETDPLHTNARGETALSLAARSKRPYIIASVIKKLIAVDRLEQGEFVSFAMLPSILGKTGRGGHVVREAFARNTLLDLYANLGVDELCLCVVRFFKRLPALCLLDCVELAAAVQLHSRSVRGYDSYRSDELQSLSARLQLAAAGCLVSLGQLKDGLGRFEVEQLLLTPRGEAAITLAIRHSCKHFLSQPPVQAFLTSEWRGPLLNAVIEGADGDFARLAAGFLVWILAALVNLFLLPFIAAVPPLGEALVNRLKRDAALQLAANVDSRADGAIAVATPGSTTPIGTPISTPSPSLDLLLSLPSIARPPSPPPSPPKSGASPTSSAVVPRLPFLFGAASATPSVIASAPLLHYYVLRNPALKFALRLASDISLALLATFHEGEPSAFIFFVWPVGGLVSEYKQLIAADGSLRNELLSWVRSDTPSSYRADLFNTVDMLCLHLLLFSYIAYYSAPSAYLPLRSLAVLALHVRLLRIIYLSPSLGALVLIMVRMSLDLYQVFVLLLFVAISLVSAMYVVADSFDPDSTPVCGDFKVMQGSWTNWLSLFFLALNAVVDGRAQDSLLMCVLYEGHSHNVFLWGFTYMFFIFVVVLCLNMLIAMFSRSFDMMYDSMSIHLQTHFARAVVAWCASSPEPPPLNLLHLPYTALSLLAKLRPRKTPRFEMRRGLRQERSSRVRRNSYDAFSGMNLHAVHQLVGSETPPAEKQHDYAGTTVTIPSLGPRNSWEIWKAKLTEEELAQEVGNFVASRVDTLVQEERWRNKIMRRLGDKFDHIEGRLDRVDETLSRLSVACEAIQKSIGPSRQSSKSEAFSI
ncbi:hypothetical protein AB1Y20_014423 [Prymnesium parvum]|uniref:Ion transport domain-containing protein n=1 Tax=Prymnesium parvum TaxID=97485 RepID=A0AB34IEA4_PRYPA